MFSRSFIEERAITEAGRTGRYITREITGGARNRVFRYDPQRRDLRRAQAVTEGSPDERRLTEEPSV